MSKNGRLWEGVDIILIPYPFCISGNFLRVVDHFWRLRRLRGFLEGRFVALS